MQLRRRRAKTSASVHRIAAPPITDHPTCRLHKRHRGLDIIGVQAGLNDQIDLPRSQKRIGVAIHAVAGQLTLLGQGVEGLSLKGAADLGKGGEDRRLRQMPRLARASEVLIPSRSIKAIPSPPTKRSPI